MYDMYEKKDQLSYGTYSSIFVIHFDIGFGYPRSDTCSTCDEFLAKIKVLRVNLKSASQLDKYDIEKVAVAYYVNKWPSLDFEMTLTSYVLGTKICLVTILLNKFNKEKLYFFESLIKKIILFVNTSNRDT